MDNNELDPTIKDAGNNVTYQTYLNERKSLIDSAQEQARNFDKYLLTLSAGTFGLSLVFINQIAPNPLSSSLPFLFVAWVAFSISIISTLVSFQCSVRAHARQIEILENKFFEKK